MSTSRMPDAYFEKVYAKEADPWGFDSRWYEARKYALTLAALPRKTYRRAFEPGCANGALTELLAARCEALLATDILDSVVKRARARLENAKHSSHVDVRRLAIPDEWPPGTFDLIVLSEVVYYLTEEGVQTLLEKMDHSLIAHGHVVAVHWTGKTDYPLTGDEVATRLSAHPTWTSLAHYREEDFVLDVYERKENLR